MTEGVSILAGECMTLFEQGITAIASARSYQGLSTARTSFIDEVGRFKAWCLTIGAFQERSIKGSLEARLKDAPFVYEQVVDLVKELWGELRCTATILREEEPNLTVSSDQMEADLRILLESSGDDLSNDEINNMIGALQGSVIRTTSDFDERLHRISGCITGLLKLSKLIRESTIRDRFSKALAMKHSGSYMPQFDIAHVKEKFPKLDQPEHLELLQRIGDIMVKRRHVLRYWKGQKERLAGKSMTGLQEPSLEDQRTETAVSSFDLQKFQNALENQASSSETSFATTISNNDPSRLRVPNISAVSGGQESFVCPFCCLLIENQTRSSWKRHVFHDLRSYFCTKRGCNAQPFESRTTWFNHERLCQGRNRKCASCQFETNSVMDFERHVVEGHERENVPLLSETLIMTCQELRSEYDSADCVFCDDFKPSQSSVGSILSYQKHVAEHMEQLALFALPLGLGEDTEGDNFSEEMNSEEDTPQKEPTMTSNRLGQNIQQRRSRNTTPVDPSPLHEYFVPNYGISQEVIMTDIRHYLGSEATVKLGSFEDPETGKVTEGYIIRAYRNFTSEMIRDLKDDSAKWENDKATGSKSSRWYQ